MTGIVYEKGLTELDEGGSVDYLNDTIKVALLSSAYTPDAEAHQSYADVIAEVSGVGYVAGGEVLPDRATNGSTPVYYQAGGLIWRLLSAINVRYALVYKDSGTPATSWLLACADLGQNYDLVGQDLVLNWDAGLMFYTSAPGVGSFTRQVQAAVDDGRVKNTSFSTASCEFGRASNGNNLNSFYRFANITVPQGSEVTNVFVTFTAAGSSSNANTNIYCNNVDNAVAPTSTAQYNALALLGPLAWNSIPAWTVNEEYDTPALTNYIQSVINREGWESGNAMMVLVKNTGTGSDRWRSPHDYGGVPSKAAKLTIEYDNTISGVYQPVVSFYDTRVRLRARKRGVLLTTKVRNIQ